MSIFLSDNVIEFRDRVVAILVDKALCLFSEGLDGLLGPPWNRVAISVILSTLIVKSMRYFVANDHSNGSIIQVPWIPFAE